MRNIKLTIEYDGTNYHGWQIQPNAITIQAAIQDALAKITKTQTQIIGAGRTDTGVHAAGQVANFHTGSQMPPISFQRALNATLPRDIVVIDVEEVSPDFHARFSAISRTYLYTILNRAYPSARLRNNAYFFPESIDVQGADTACQSSSVNEISPLSNAPAVSELTQSVRFTNVDVGRRKIWSILRLRRMPFYEVWCAPLSAPS